MTVEWRGSALLELVAQASKEAIDEQNQAVESTAKSRVHRVTGRLQENIDVWPAQRKGDVVSGAVGVDSDVPYALIEEIRHPFLRPAYDSEAPSLGKRIAAKTKRQIK